MVSLLVLVLLVVLAIVAVIAISLLTIGLFFYMRRARVLLRKGSSDV